MAYCAAEPLALALAEQLRARKLPWVVDVVQAYTSVAVFFDPGQVDGRQVQKELASLQLQGQTYSGQLHQIPCCYELGLDLERIAQATGLEVKEVIKRHVEQVYTVYAIGFCPGFPYLGYLPQALAGVPRLPSPRVQVEPGSVGLTGRQTGIYTEARPGGWNIVGRTPLELVNVAEGYFPLRTGDRMQFRSITKEEYRELEGKRLEAITPWGRSGRKG
jgi:inhibitor of KinA